MKSLIFLTLPLHALLSIQATVQGYSASAAQLHRSAGRRAFASKSKPFAPMFGTTESSDAAAAAAAAAPSKSSDKTDDQTWTKARVHNTPLFRAAALLGAGLLAQTQSQLLSSKSLAVLHVLSFGTWFGSVVYTTFIAGITMFQHLPKKTFGRLQAKLFPKYFLLGSACLILQLASLAGMTKLSPPTMKQSRVALTLALAMTLLNQFVLEPTATKNMLERYRLEEDGKESSDEYKKLKKSFGKFHGISSLTNLIALCGGVAHAVYLAAALV